MRFEGESEGRPIIRRAEITPKADWTEQRIRVSNLPPGGLDRLRLRFELLAPGQLWVDDLNLLGQRLSDPDRRAQRTLTAAVQKFREKRYADFARLANSYWSHTAATEPIRTSANAPSRDRRIR